MQANDYVRARINSDIKQEAAAVLANIGLTVSDACRMMLTKIAHDKCLPFGHEPSCERSYEPNAETIQAIEDARNGVGLYEAKDAEDLFKQLGI